MSDPAAAPLILTLTLDEASQAFFDEQRQRYFPANINYLSAHLTLFHALPAAEAPTLLAQLKEATTPLPATLPLSVSGVSFMGRGVMYTLESPPLRALHRHLQQQWRPLLTAQDQQGLRPHITVQNKVDPAVARALHTELAGRFEPFEAHGTGLTLWTYRGGPWELRQRFPFGG